MRASAQRLLVVAVDYHQHFRQPLTSATLRLLPLPAQLPAHPAALKQAVILSFLSTTCLAQERGFNGHAPTPARVGLELWRRGSSTTRPAASLSTANGPKPTRPDCLSFGQSRAVPLVAETPSALQRQAKLRLSCGARGRRRITSNARGCTCSTWWTDWAACRSCRRCLRGNSSASCCVCRQLLLLAITASWRILCKTAHLA